MLWDQYKRWKSHCPAKHYLILSVWRKNTGFWKCHSWKQFWNGQETLYFQFCSRHWNCSRLTSLMMRRHSYTCFYTRVIRNNGNALKHISVQFLHHSVLSSNRRCALHCAFSSFTWDNSQSWKITSHPWAHKHKISLLWCFATWLLQDCGQDVHATQKTVSLHFDPLFHSHNHSICDWVWLSPEKQLLTLGLPSGKSNAYAMLMSELVQPNCF